MHVTVVVTVSILCYFLQHFFVSEFGLVEFSSYYLDKNSDTTEIQISKCFIFYLCSDLSPRKASALRH